MVIISEVNDTAFKYYIVDDLHMKAWTVLSWSVLSSSCFLSKLYPKNRIDGFRRLIDNLVSMFN